MDDIEIPVLDPTAFDDVIGAQRADEFAAALDGVRAAGGVVWHVNATSQGGGVAEMLHSVLGYVRGAGVRCRWLVIEGSAPFFDLTKQLHHMLHGEPGEHGAIPPDARKVYDDALASDARQLAALVGPRDVVVLHDPQVLGLAPHIASRCAGIIWNCHIGADTPNALAQQAREFLLPYVEHTDRQVFSRSLHVWDTIDPTTVSIIPPCLDAFSPKNQPMTDETVDAVLRSAGVFSGPRAGQARFVRQDRTEGRITTRVEMVEDEPLPIDVPLVTQISRWDPLKDHEGVMAGFADHVARESDAHLVLAGPDPDAVDDDPEGCEVLAGVRSRWAALPADVRQRVHLALLPMTDVDENAAIVNALQRASDVIVQKSLAEGFGLTVAEASWKGKPVIGTRVGGIQDQIEHGTNGLLVDDPEDLAALGAATRRLLREPDVRRHMGMTGHKRVVERYLAPTYLTRYLALVDSLRPSGTSSAA